MTTHLHGPPLIEALSEAALKVHAALSFDGVLEAAAGQLKEIGISLAVVQWKTEGLVLTRHNLELPAAMRAALGPEPWVVASHDHASDRLPLRAAQIAGRPIYFDDLDARLSPHLERALPKMRDPLIEGFKRLGFARAVVAPVKVRDTPWGGLVLSWPSMQREDSFAVGLFALHFGSALQAADTIGRLQARNHELEAVHELATAGVDQSVEAMATKLLKVVLNTTGAEVAAIYRFDADQQEYVQVVEPQGRRPGDAEQWRRFPGSPLLRTLGGPVAWAVKDLPDRGEVVRGLGLRQVLVAPMVVEGRPVGLLATARHRDEPFDAADLQVAERLGAQAAAFLERSRLHEEAARRVRQLSLLYDLARTGASIRQVQPLVDRLLGRMVETFPADLGSLHFTGPGGFHLAGWRRRDGQTGEPPPASVPLDERSVIGLTALRRKAMACSAPDFPPQTRENGLRYGFNQLMAAPLEAGGMLMGCISLARQGLPFSREEQELLESVASQTAVLVEQARLYDDLRNSYVELGRAQAEVVRHERLAALGEVAAVMAHEVRNPLGVIFNSLTSLKKLLVPTGDVELLLRIVGEEADRLNRIVADLLDFARPYAPERKPVALDALVASAVQSASAALATPGIRLVTEFPEVLPEVALDAHLVRQALVNLVVNAVQAMPRGGTVTVRALTERQGDRGWARIAVSDQGPGIPPQAAGRIFQPFFTTKATGTGLGLAVVKRIAEAQQGDVLVDSGPEGTTFTLRLPLQ